jgi:hypothetical protein
MGTGETSFYDDLAGRPCDAVAEWIVVARPCFRIEPKRKANAMKRLFMAACALAALIVPASAYTSRKTAFCEFMEFEELTVERNTMNHTSTVSSEYTRCVPISQVITDSPLVSTCYVGGVELDTEQLTAPYATTSESKAQPDNLISSDFSEFSNSTIGSNEGTQLNARLV